MTAVRKCTYRHTHSLLVVSLNLLLCVPTSLYRLISNNNSLAGWVFGQQLSLHRGTAHLSNRGSFAGVTACLNMRPLALQARPFSPLCGSSCAEAFSLPLSLPLSPSPSYHLLPGSWESQVLYAKNPEESLLSWKCGLMQAGFLEWQVTPRFPLRYGCLCGFFYLSITFGIDDRADFH